MTLDKYITLTRSHILTSQFLAWLQMPGHHLQKTLAASAATLPAPRQTSLTASNGSVPIGTAIHWQSLWPTGGHTGNRHVHASATLTQSLLGAQNNDLNLGLKHLAITQPSTSPQTCPSLCTAAIVQQPNTTGPAAIIPCLVPALYTVAA